MVKFGPADMATNFELGERAAALITAAFKPPIQLEFEKTYQPYLLFSKKRYAGLMYTRPDKPDYVDSKGIQLVRRDNCKLVRTVSAAVLHKVMYERDVDGAVAVVQDAVKRLLAGEVPLDDLVLSKTLRNEYKVDNQPHVLVARKIEERNGIAGSGPRSGERVPYVFVETDDPTAKQFMKAEDPAYAEAAGLPVDVLYYLEHQLESPIIALFELLMPNPYKTIFQDLKSDFVKKRAADVKEWKRKDKLKRQRQHEITSFFKPAA